MSKKVIEQIKFCKICGMETLHRKNSEQLNWLLHLVLAIFTAGFWIIPFIFICFFHMFTKIDTSLTNRWVCTQCNNNKKLAGLFDGK